MNKMLNVKEVAIILSCADPTAYKKIKEVNESLKRKNKHVDFS